MATKKKAVKTEAQSGKPSVVIVEVNDWSAIYVNGKAVSQQHVCSLRDLLTAFEDAGLKTEDGFKLERRFIDNEDLQEQVDNSGALPDDLSEVPES